MPSEKAEARRFLSRHGYASVVVWRVDQMTPTACWVAFTAAGQPKTAILGGSAQDWRLVREMDGWPVP